MGEFRYEKKFVLSRLDLGRLLRWQKEEGTCFKLSYPSRRVNNIYFDSHEYDLFNESNSGNSNRFKCRLRWYGESLDPKQYQFEVKIKRNTCGTKLTQSVDGISLSGLNAFSLSKKLKEQLKGEVLHYFCQTPRPVLINSYKRDYYETSFGLRMTIDNKIRSSKFRDYFFDFKLIPPMDDIIVLELKYPQELERKMIEAVGSFPFRPFRHSKYCFGMLKQNFLI